MRDRLRDHLIFFGQILKATDEVGAFAATNRAVAEALAEPLSQLRGPRRVLEAGAGTGAITRALVDRLGPADKLDVVEINPTFVKVLQERFGNLPGGPQVRVIQRDVASLADEQPYDMVCSSLPLLNMEPAKVDEVFRLFLRLLRPEGQLVYFDYWAKEVRRFIAPDPRERRRMKDVLRVTRRYLDQHERERRLIMRNLPPALVHYLRP